MMAWSLLKDLFMFCNQWTMKSIAWKKIQRNTWKIFAELNCGTPSQTSLVDFLLQSFKINPLPWLFTILCSSSIRRGTRQSFKNKSNLPVSVKFLLLKMTEGMFGLSQNDITLYLFFRKNFLPRCPRTMDKEWTLVGEKESRKWGATQNALYFQLTGQDSPLSTSIERRTKWIEATMCECRGAS